MPSRYAPQRGDNPIDPWLSWFGNYPNHYATEDGYHYPENGRHQMMRIAPDRTEAAAFYFTYINRVPEGEICGVLDSQAVETIALFEGISNEQSLGRYAPDKWSIREVVGHINDAERLFASRAFWFARGFEAPLPDFDQNVAAAAAGAHGRAWGSLVNEFRTVRAATLSLFRNLPEDAWIRRGISSNNPITVRALAYVLAGHAAHHVSVLRERYLRTTS
jgi:hypothetical protein